MQASDQELMKNVREGDEMALEQLIRRHGSDLLGYLFRMTSDRPQAEDLVQEAFIRVYTKARSYTLRRPFKPWLYAIATRLALDFLRGRSRHPAPASLDAAEEAGAPLGDAVTNGSPSPADAAESADTRKEVRVAISKLPPRQRATLNLAYFEGLTYPEVAKVMRCSVGTVKTQMSRALRALARILPDADTLGVPGGVS